MEEDIYFEDLEEEEVDVKIDKNSFDDKIIHCDKCEEIMEKKDLEIEIPNSSLLMKIEVFECKKCKKQYLNGEQADKLDRALSIGKVIERKGMKYERAGNFDGNNVFVRFPAQMIKEKNVNAEIHPISQNEFFVFFKKRALSKEN